MRYTILDFEENSIINKDTLTNIDEGGSEKFDTAEEMLVEAIKELRSKKIPVPKTAKMVDMCNQIFDYLVEIEANQKYLDKITDINILFSLMGMNEEMTKMKGEK